MKQRIGKISVTALVILVLALAISLVTQAPAVPRSYDNDVRTVVKTSTLAGTTDQLYTVTGGRIEVVSLFGECTTAAGSPGDTLIQLDATAGSDYDREYSTTVNIDALAVGDLVRFTNAIDEGVIDFTANMGAGQTLSWMVSPGEIELNTAAGTTGAIVWYMSYRKLESGAKVVAAD